MTTPTPTYYICYDCSLKLHPSQVIAGTHRFPVRDYDTGRIVMRIHNVTPIYEEPRS